MKQIKIIDFWKNGSLGPIHLGMTSEEVISILGPTDYISPISRKDNRPEILKYGFIEFHFNYSQKLNLIYSDDFVSDSGNFKISFISEEISENMTHEEIVQLLNSIGCTFEEYNDPYNEQSIILRLNSGVEIGISLCDSEFSNKGLYGYWIKDEISC